MWKIKGSNFILLLVISMRFSDGAFIPFEEDKSEKSEEIGNGSNGKVCREKCGDTFRRDCFNIATIGAFGTPFVGGLLAATGAATRITACVISYDLAWNCLELHFDICI